MKIAILLLALAGCTPAWSAETVSPHGSTTGCAACHDPTEDGTPPEKIVWTTGNPNTACRKCHADDPHQVDLVPVRAKPDAIALMFNGRVACFSCHDEPACDAAQILPMDPYFFRGGPYQSQGELCGRCHDLSGTARFNPHEAMVQGDRGEVCEHCHLEAPDPEQTEADLKIDGPNICLGCHKDSVHAGSKLHMTTLSAAMSRRARAAGLPVGVDRKAVCVTCHDPHPSNLKSSTVERGVNKGRPVFGTAWQEQVMDEANKQRGEQVGAPIKPVTEESDFVRLPLADGQLCVACHDAAGIEATRRSER
jgi:predicted CXXCH cytochrome family protein